MQSSTPIEGRGAGRGTRLQPNVALTPGGCVRVVQRRVPAFDLDKDLEGNAASELRPGWVKGHSRQHSFSAHPPVGLPSSSPACGSRCTPSSAECLVRSCKTC